MSTGGIIDQIHNISNWILRFFYVNFLWIMFSFLGLLFFGIFPSTVAMFSVVRKWIFKETPIYIFNTFWTVYKSQFLKSNLLGYSLSIVGFIIFLDIVLLRQLESPFFQLL